MRSHLFRRGRRRWGTSQCFFRFPVSISACVPVRPTSTSPSSSFSRPIPVTHARPPELLGFHLCRDVHLPLHRGPGHRRSRGAYRRTPSSVPRSLPLAFVRVRIRKLCIGVRAALNLLALVIRFVDSGSPGPDIASYPLPCASS